MTVDCERRASFHSVSGCLSRTGDADRGSADIAFKSSFASRPRWISTKSGRGLEMAEGSFDLIVHRHREMSGSNG